MPKRIDADRVIELVADGATLLDVLPSSIYEQEHLPDAISRPLETFSPEALADLAREKPIITYCFDQHCDLSSRAANRLELEGFTEVYDLIGGRATWTALGLPTEGSVADHRRISNYVQPAPSVPTGSTIGDLAGHEDDAHEGAPVAVVNADGILLGALMPTARDLPADTPVEQAMVPAPATLRPEQRIEDVIAQLRKDGLPHIYVTTVSGALLGLVYTDELHV